jgi:hypothetical protein
MFRVFKFVTITLNALLSPVKTFNSALYQISKNPISNPTFPAKKPYIRPPKKPLFQPPNKHVSILFLKLISDTAPKKPYSNPPKTLIQGTRKPNLMWHYKKGTLNINPSNVFKFIIL